MSVQQLKRVFLDDILPTWSKSGFDETCGQFVEYLELDGSSQKSGEVRTRTVARQIYVHAHAAHLGLAPSESLAMAERAFANLHRVAWVSGKRSGYVRGFNRHTELITDPVRDLYDNACVLLALSWLLTATGKDVYRHDIDQTILAVDRTLTDPFGGWAEDSDGTLPRRQNPHMHYLEASLALCENNRTPKHMRSEGKAFALLRSHFLVGPNGTLHEFFGPQWELADRYGSDRLEPGHMCEWVWLTTRHDNLARSDNTKTCLDLFSTALAVGRMPGSLFLVDTVSVVDKAISPSRRLWPQVEMLKAFMALHERFGFPGYRTGADDVASAILAAYMTGVPHGCWHDRLDLNGTPLSSTIPASSLYHLWTTIAASAGDLR
ncbi:AGE family epimerase/isomerase [Rhizobium halophytocola]|uniref:Mannose/cellobiose epimerase-like protein (N-acyl-D-glucosamine 2-epimerase family) n=1 Tax=Rhizobium halophytocola TaxID=735519 RepID=A0ABS4E4E2_9HYPH|nr:AGE family epimerase/isomerase [Rhizobium halophytocola]MBP1852782.1 mannose/cellobiose epimerase-like protein (N-acyl-D-glucosamine 2-epimerase family) [Rhizobium halophytocola]